MEGRKLRSDARTHSKRQGEPIMASTQEFGFVKSIWEIRTKWYLPVTDILRAVLAMGLAEEPQIQL